METYIKVFMFLVIFALMYPILSAMIDNYKAFVIFYKKPGITETYWQSEKRKSLRNLYFIRALLAMIMLIACGIFLFILVYLLTLENLLGVK